MTFQENQSDKSKASPVLRSRAGWINAVLIPVKQHLGCCVLLPLAANAMGGGASSWLASEQAEWALFATVPPLVTYGVMQAEQKIHAYRHRNKPTCCTHTTLTRAGYLKQTALAYLFYAASHLLTHHVSHWDHAHKETQTPVTHSNRSPS